MLYSVPTGIGQWRADAQRRYPGRGRGGRYPPKPSEQLISYEEWLDQLAKVGLGWMGWTEDEVLRCDINALNLAHLGRVDMLQAIFGKPPGTSMPRPKGGGDKEATLPPLTPQAFDTVFGKPKGRRSEE